MRLVSDPKPNSEPALAWNFKLDVMLETASRPEASP